MMDQDINIILFLCTGNVFRSAFCEKYFNKYYSNTPHLALSRGTDLYYSSVDSAVVQAANKYNLSLEEHRPISISEDIVRLSSEILIMDNSHKNYMENNYPEHLYKIRFLGEYYDVDKVLEIGDVKRNNSQSFEKNVAWTFTVLSKSIDNMIIGKK